MGNSYHCLKCSWDASQLIPEIDKPRITVTCNRKYSFLHTLLSHIQSDLETIHLPQYKKEVFIFPPVKHWIKWQFAAFRVTLNSLSIEMSEN